LPRAIAERVGTVRKAENRSRSELVREALQAYFALTAKFPEEEATPTERRAIERGRRAVARGEFVTLERFLDELEADPGQPAAKRP